MAKACSELLTSYILNLGVNMVFALIFAGGVGARMHTDGIPKQFLKVYGKPIIVHTLEKFQEHSGIDRIIVVSVKSHLRLMHELVKNYNITKVLHVVAGGATGQESIWNGLKVIKDYKDDNDIVLIHDGVRPIVTHDLIDKNIKTSIKSGNAISACFAWETVCQAETDQKIGAILPRQNCLLARAPQTFRVRDIVSAHMEAQTRGDISAVDSATLMHQCGHKLHYVPCDQSNIKITTPIDFYVFKGLLEAQESMQVLGL